MSKAASTRKVGIDVSAATLHVAAEGRDGVAKFDNTPAGFKKLLNYITKGRVRLVQVVMEATGSYHLDLACFLDDQAKCEVMVVDPRSSNAFHKAQGRRAKTDKVDAMSLLMFVQSMPFLPWTRPSDHVLEVRSASRYVDQLVKQQTRLKNQLHAASATDTTSIWVREGLLEQLRHTESWVKGAKLKLVALVKGGELGPAMKNLSTMRGVGELSACQMVAEFAVLNPTMTSKQITAWAGVDPMPHQSGTSVNGRRKMSKRGNARVRRILYMCSLSAAKSGPFADLKERVTRRSGKKMVGQGAVMRKVLIVAWAMYRTGRPWDAKLAARRDEISENAA